MLALAPRLESEGILIRAIVPPGKLAQAWEAAGADVILWSAGRDDRRPRDRRRAAEELTAGLGRLAPRLVHANSLAMGRIVGPLARRLAIPSITHLRDIVGLSRRAVSDLNENARLLAVSNAVRSFHVTQGVDAAITHVAYNGVDLNTFRPQRRTGWLRRELALEADTRLVGAIGQVSLRKGWDVLLDAAAKVLDRVPNAAFVLVGGRYSQKAETRAVERSLTEMVNAFPRQVFWLGERDDVPRIMPELDVLAHASRQEPLGRVLLEASASGIAVVATDVGGTREVFPPERAAPPAAMLVPPNDPAAVAGAIQRLLDDAPLRASLAAASRQRAVEAFGADAAADVLLRHYREVAGK